MSSESPDRGPAGAVPRSPDGPIPAGTFGLQVKSVSEVTRAIRERVRADDGLRDLWVEGEIGRVTVSTAGHAYFALKDAKAQLQCVWFRDERVRSAFQPQTGLQVIVHGRMDVFEPQGALQLYVDSLQPSGFGNLAIRFEQLKARLSEEGLFDAARKRQLPDRPGVIAVVTSPTGAVWRDVCNVLARRWPLARVLLVACQVQGDGAPASIVGALHRLERWVEDARRDGHPDEAPAVTILARGGGSLEDLWSFNDERVVRAIVAHPVPLVCGVGHEVDVTLADFAADVRAPTPSAAAELVVPDRADAQAALRARRGRLDALVTGGLGGARRELIAERRILDRLDPAVRLAESRERASLLLDRATRATLSRLAGARATEERVAGRQHALAAARVARGRATLDASASALAALGPQATLERGYAIARRRSDGGIVRDPADAPAGTGLRVTLAGGDLGATVDAEPG
jgi:exodeoxyribonuclease VII large subunit